MLVVVHDWNLHPTLALGFDIKALRGLWRESRVGDMAM
jgi:hypothetical protein